MKRLGAGRGTGKGYRNLRQFPRDSNIHSQSAKGMKQPQLNAPTFRFVSTKPKREWMGGESIPLDDREKPLWKQLVMIRTVARENGMDSPIFEEFMIRRFPNEPDPNYIAQWVRRFKSGHPTAYMDSQSYDTYLEILNEQRGRM